MASYLIFQTKLVQFSSGITHLPPSAFGYFHVGKKIEIGKRGLYSPIDAHRQDSYLRELEKLGI